MPSLRARSSKHCLATHLKIVCLALVVSLCRSAALSAQGTGGRILGRIADPIGAVLSGVKVTATNEATGVSQDVRQTTTAAITFSRIFRSAPTRSAST